jgi:hypothetical protein
MVHAGHDESEGVLHNSYYFIPFVHFGRKESKFFWTGHHVQSGPLGWVLLFVTVHASPLWDRNTAEVMICEVKPYTRVVRPQLFFLKKKKTKDNFTSLNMKYERWNHTSNHVKLKKQNKKKKW